MGAFGNHFANGETAVGGGDGRVGGAARVAIWSAGEERGSGGSDREGRDCEAGAEEDLVEEQEEEEDESLGDHAWMQRHFFNRERSRLGS